MTVAKFGGSSVGSPEAIRKLVSIVQKRRQELLVVAAFAGVTDTLATLARAALAGEPEWRGRLGALAALHRDAIEALVPQAQRSKVDTAVGDLLGELTEILGGIRLIRELTPRTLDLVMSFGELLSAEIVAAALRASGLPATAVDARPLIVAAGGFGNARADMEATEAAIRSGLAPLIAPVAEVPLLPVLTGFIGRTKEGDTVTLGRGGADYTASVVGAILGASEIEIWTDSDGIHTADPRKVQGARSIPLLSYEEAAELSHFGAQVIYPPTIQPALAAGIPIRILNTFNTAFEGTLLAREAPPPASLVRGVSSVPEACLVRLQGPGMVGLVGAAARLFGCIAQRGINIVVITQASSEHSICFAVAPRDREGALHAIAQEFAREIADGRIEPPVAESNKAILAVVGEGMRHTKGIAGRVFRSLARAGVNIAAIAQGSSELNISIVVDAADERTALGAAHDAFFRPEARVVSVWLAGLGLVGGTLLAQIANNIENLRRQFGIELRIAGLANSRRMLVRPEGIDPRRWKELLEAEGEPADLGAFAARMGERRLPGSVFVDCTASAAPTAVYARVLREGASLVTANKRAGAGPYPVWREILEASRLSGATFLYETTAGAALPVISTLRDLVVSGDRITRIDAALSGTLGFVISAWNAGQGSFSSLVRRARELGFTEPDPRDDLSALDLARKAVIIAREAGLPVELADVAIDPIVPASCAGAGNVEEFLEALERAEDELRPRLERAREKGASLVYVASVTRDRSIVGWREVMPGEPLHGLRGAESAVVFTTDHYTELPLVVRGPGAGAAVTAAGVFADIVRSAGTERPWFFSR